MISRLPNEIQRWGWAPLLELFPTKALSFCGAISGCEQTFTKSMLAVGDRQSPGELLEWA